jgi:Fe(3+) dicitrate transport protein
LYVKGNNRSYFGQGAQTTISMNFNTGKIKHDLDVGIRFHQDGFDRFQNEDIFKMLNGTMMQTSAGELGRESNRIGFAQALASYLQYKTNYKKFNLTAGLRNELITMEEKDYGKNDPTRLGTNLVQSKNNVAVWIPGISIDYIYSSRFTAFVGVHKGFSPPSAKTSSKAEESINYEAGIKFNQTYFQCQLVGFYNAYSNLLGSDLAASGGIGTGDLFNGGKSFSSGIEWFSSLNIAQPLRLPFKLPLTVAYTYTDARFLSDFSSTFEDWGTVKSGDQLPYLAQHQLNIGLAFEYKKWQINTGMKYTSEMRATAGTGSATGIDRIPAIIVLDASISYQVSNTINVFSSVTNLTNETYIVAARPSGVRPGMPRAIQIGIRATIF